MSPVRDDDTRAPRGKGSGRFFLVVLLALGAAAVLEFVGPTRGWFQRLRRHAVTDQSPAERESSSSPGTDTHLPPSPGRQVGFLDEGGVQTTEAARIGQASAPASASDAPLAKTELEKQYEALYAKFLEGVRAPAAGDKVRLKLRDGTKVEGILENRFAGRIALRVKYGTMTYALHQIDPQFTDRLFPQRVAQRKAMQELKRLREQKAQAQELASVVTESRKLPETEERERSGPKPQERVEQPAVAPPASASTGPVRYDPRPAKTPAHLTATIQAFGRWLEMQHRRVGGRIARKIHAKQQGRCAVLYLVMDPLFLAQDYDTRFRLAEGVQQFWVFRCEANKVVSALSDAHIVLVDENAKVIGGSRSGNNADVWVSGSTGGAMAQR